MRPKGTEGDGLRPPRRQECDAADLSRLLDLAKAALTGTILASIHFKGALRHVSIVVSQEAQMNKLLTRYRLRRQNDEFAGSGGVSSASRSLGFIPAFRDSETGQIYRSCFQDGTPAPCHLLEGLPAALGVMRDADGRIVAVKGTVVVGFLHAGRFYTREEAASAVSQASSD